MQSTSHTSCGSWFACRSHHCTAEANPLGFMSSAVGLPAAESLNAVTSTFTSPWPAPVGRPAPASRNQPRRPVSVVEDTESG